MLTWLSSRTVGVALASQCIDNTSRRKSSEHQTVQLVNREWFSGECCESITPMHLGRHLQVTLQSCQHRVSILFGRLSNFPRRDVDADVDVDVDVG